MPKQTCSEFESNDESSVNLFSFFHILIYISLKFVPKDQNDDKLILIQMIICRQTGDKPWHEPMVTQMSFVLQGLYLACISMGPGGCENIKKSILLPV